MSALLEARGLTRLYPVGSGAGRGTLHALAGVDLSIARGESVGLVGESGCGKSTLARVLARLIDPSAGALRFKGDDLLAVPLRRFIASPHRPKIQMVFQDPTESLNPHLTVAEAIADPIRRLLRPSGRAEVEERVNAALDQVGLPRELADRYPHQLSGGQKARVGIGRAIAVEPELLILDEPTSALDVSVQAVILKLLADLRDRLGMSYVFVSHDLEVVRLLCERVVVMYLGEIVETAPTSRLFDAAAHPYTRALIGAIPDPARRGARPARLDGSPRSPVDPDPAVCQFHGRCPHGGDACTRSRPALRSVGPEHRAACHFVTTVGPEGSGEHVVRV
jgi:oligopeptide/dipeptide ABC transporter ATP-binding protein